MPRLLPALTLGLAIAAPALAETQRYDVLIRGIKAGRMELATAVEGDRYAANGAVGSAGLVSAIVRFSFNGKVQGRVLPSGGLQPTSYSAVAVEGDRRRSTAMTYRSGVPASVSVDPPRSPRPTDIAAADQGGAVDPISATMALLSAAEPDRACSKSVDVYDGNRRSRLSLAGLQRTNQGWQCQGEYRRVAGFSAKDMAERPTFPFTVYWREGDDGRLHVTGFRTETLYGSVRAIRR